MICRRHNPAPRVGAEPVAETRDREDIEAKELNKLLKAQKRAARAGKGET